jgi:hypothetical protein
MFVKSHVYKYLTFYAASASFLLFDAAVAQASSTTKYSSCFNQAETYYEQIYCEIKAKGKGVSLPSFVDFKKNNGQMQALLLKRKAEALNIPFTMQKKKSVVSKKNKKVDESTENAYSINCQYLERTIKCHDGVFLITGNKSNSVLQRVALSSKNKLRLYKFTGDRNNKIQVLDYLTKSYTRYIEKMLEIGLAGATMSFTKFYYIFHDLSDQGVNFQQRFETMYAYLKVDKRSLGVAEDVNVIQGLTIAHCSRLKNDLFTCDNGTTNRVYIR